MYMQVRMPLACFFILIFAFWNYMRREGIKTIASNIFKMAAVGGIFHTVCVIVTEYTVNNRDEVPEVFNYIWHVFFLISLSFYCIMIYNYLVCHIERGIGHIKKKERIVMNLLSGLSVVCEIVLPIKYIDTPNGSYSLGAKAYALYVVVVYVTIMMIYNLISYRNVLESRLRKALACIVLIFVIVSAVQMIFPYILLTDLAVTMTIIGIMLNTEDSHMYINYDTGLYNESGCKEIIKELVLRRKEFKAEICVFFGETSDVIKVKNDLKKRIRHRYKSLVCGSLQYNMLLIIPSASFYGKSHKFGKMPEMIGEVKCVSETMSFDSSQSVDDIFKQINERKNSCCANEMNADELTGLLRRTGYAHQVNQLIEDNKCFSFVMIDIDNFKNINDTYGHAVGDEVLKFAADTFRNSIRSTDIACRMGGDEFSLVLCNIAERELAEKIISKLMSKMKLTVLSDVLQLNITLSVGVKIYTPTEKISTFEELYRLSDKALYKAKYGGKNRIHFSV